MKKGFKDKYSNLFFEITQIVDAKRSKIVLLENVPNLIAHNNGKTFLVINNGLAQFGYAVYCCVLASNDYGNLPQTRKHIYTVTVREDIAERTYCYPESISLTLKSSDIIQHSVKQHDIYYYTSGKMYDRLVYI